MNFAKNSGPSDCGKNEDGLPGLSSAENRVDKCCSHLNDSALLGALMKHALTPPSRARREEEKSRAKKGFSLRIPLSMDPRISGLNSGHTTPESMRNDYACFPFEQLDGAPYLEYIKLERSRCSHLLCAWTEVIVQNGILIPLRKNLPVIEKSEKQFLAVSALWAVFPARSHCLCGKNYWRDNRRSESSEKSERENRVIDLTSDSSWNKKRKKDISSFRVKNLYCVLRQPQRWWRQITLIVVYCMKQNPSMTTSLRPSRNFQEEGTERS